MIGTWGRRVSGLVAVVVLSLGAGRAVAAAPPTPVATKRSAPRAVAALGDSVYWIEQDSGVLARAPAPGGKAEIVAGVAGVVGNLATCSAGLFFAACTGAAAGRTCVIEKIAAAGASPTVVASAGKLVPTALASDGALVVFTHAHGVSDVPASGGSVASVTRSAAVRPLLGLDDNGIYWAESATGREKPRLLAVRAPGAKPRTVASLDAVPTALTVVSGTIFFTTADGLSSVPTSGGSPSLGLAHGALAPAVAADADAVYVAGKGVDPAIASAYARSLAGPSPTQDTLKQVTDRVRQTMQTGWTLHRLTPGHPPTSGLLASSPTSMVTDARTLYWTDAAGDVIKLEKR